jgi:AcrR family transcriptional regulator
MNLRADAEGNRRAIVDAAGQLFAEQGLGAPLDEIAKRAGVGSATLYRRFPDRCALVETVFAEQMDDYAAATRAALEAGDPWAGFVGLLTHMCAAQAADLGLAELLTTTLFDAGPRLAEIRREALENVRALIEHLHGARLLPADFADPDVVLVLIGNAGVVRATRADAPEAWQRHLAFVLAGLRQASAGPAMPPPPSREEIEAAMRSGFLAATGQAKNRP